MSPQTSSRSQRAPQMVADQLTFWSNPRPFFFFLTFLLPASLGQNPRVDKRGRPKLLASCWCCGGGGLPFLRGVLTQISFREHRAFPEHLHLIACRLPSIAPSGGSRPSWEPLPRSQRAERQLPMLGFRPPQRALCLARVCMVHSACPAFESHHVYQAINQCQFV